jgi:hypothetical protein
MVDGSGALHTSFPLVESLQRDFPLLSSCGSNDIESPLRLCSGQSLVLREQGATDAAHSRSS